MFSAREVRRVRGLCVCVLVLRSWLSMYVYVCACGCNVASSESIRNISIVTSSASASFPPSAFDALPPFFGLAYPHLLTLDQTFDAFLRTFARLSAQALARGFQNGRL